MDFCHQRLVHIIHYTAVQSPDLRVRGFAKRRDVFGRIRDLKFMISGYRSKKRENAGFSNIFNLELIELGSSFANIILV